MKAFHSFENILSHADQSGDNRALWLALFLVFALLFSWTPWQSNEEHYFQLAYRTFAPAGVSEFHAAFDQSAGRLFADYIIGSLISTFGYDLAHLVLRITQCVLYATGFMILFNALGLSVLSSIAAIALFVLFGEELFGEEWLFRGVEAKTFAYGAAVAALGLSVRAKWAWATFLMAVSTWLHFLVGGFWMIALAVYAFIKEEKIALPIKLIVVYSILVLPLFIAIAMQQFGQTLPAGAPFPTEIWAERNSHHVAPFLGAVSQWAFWDWSDGIAATFLTLLALAVYIPFARNKQFLGLVLFLLSYLLIALAVSFADRHTYYFSQFVMFRPSSLALLLTIVAVLIELRDADSRRTLLLRQLSLTALILFFVVQQAGIWVSHNLRPSRQDLQGLVTAILHHSGPGEIVIAQPPAGGFNDLDVYLPRQLDRPTLVSDKYIPSFPPLIIRWDELRQKREALFAGSCDALAGYPVRLLITYDDVALEAVQRCGSTVWGDGKFSIVSMSRQF